MKKILTIITAALLSSTLNAQTPVTMGDFIIDGYVGIPNWANSLLYNQYDGSNSSVRNY